MENAWLDSLSEDWISQPRSAGSPSRTSVGSIRSLPNSSPTSEPYNRRRTSSRIPVPNLKSQSIFKESGSPNLPLSERSSNDLNIPLPQRSFKQQSKLRKEPSNSSRGRKLSRTVSESSTGSIQHHTVHHKSLSLSPQKLRVQNDTPEWKRRLINCDVTYGEQRDLFSPAGLENIFRPPLTQGLSSFISPELLQAEDTTMPSSPPPYTVHSQSQPKSSYATSPEDERSQVHAKQPRAMKYRMEDIGSDQFSDNDLSRSSSFHAAQFTSRRVSRLALQESGLDDIGEESERQTESINGPGNDRVISGHSDGRHEDLSPIFISRHNTVDGRIDYAAVDLPGSELQQRLQDLNLMDQTESSYSGEENSRMLANTDAPDQGEIREIGSFVNLERGGKLEKDFFRAQMLSSSSLPPTEESAMLQDGSMEASTPKDLPRVEKTASLPEDFPISEPEPFIALKPRHVDGFASNMTPGSGSPLKLFGEYNTFTKQKLLRRLSQFEENLPDESTENVMQDFKAGESASFTEMNEAYIAPSSLSKTADQSGTNKEVLTSRNISQFGVGQLNDFEFSEEPLESSRIVSETLREILANTGEVHNLQKGFNLRLQPSPRLKSQTIIEKHTSQISTSLKQRVVTTKKSVRRASQCSETSVALPVSQHLDVLDTPRKRYGDNESKRLLRSPPKIPTPKRRRTLHEAEISHGTADRLAADVTKESHEQIQSIVGKKRKDARHGETQETANPQVMAMRQILRPRTPTPNQRFSQEQKRNGHVEVTASKSEHSMLEQQENIARVQAELDLTVPGKPLNAIGVGQPMHEESRKGSVTTQDFLDEAKKIMAGIRNKARPSSGLASLEESESESDKQNIAENEIYQDDSYQESTKEPFSRPPSRDGAPLTRLPRRQEDPEVIDHLRKYEEMTELDDIIASSLKSIKLAKDAVISASEIDRITDETISRASDRGFSLEEGYRSEPPNIRITEYPELQRKRKHSTSSVLAGIDGHLEPDFPSQGSSASSGPSTGRSIPTGSSRGSDSRHVIAPHTVSHLIPQQLAGMVFDHEKKMWVKWKTASGEVKCKKSFEKDDSDDDPFGDIPDLTIDETQELHRLQAVAARQREGTRISEVQRYQDCSVAAGRYHLGGAGASGITDDLNNKKHTISSNPAGSTLLDSLSLAQATCHPSKGNEPDAVGTSQNDAYREASGTLGLAEAAVEEVEQEISLHESRTEFGSGTTRRRNMTISFSSPLTSIIPPDYHELTRRERKEDFGECNNFIQQNPLQKSCTANVRLSQQTASRRLSLGGRNFIARPVSRIDERDEEAFVNRMEDNYLQNSMSVMISTPLPIRNNSDDMSIIPSSSASRRSDGILQLTPLAEFTINQQDESFALEVSYLGHQHRQQYSTTGKRVLSLSVKDLVQRITDVEPYEPFWEHMKQLELRGKNMCTLHMLSKFCSRLEELDVSNNQISQLDGAPSTIRHLQLSNNCLSDLTSWSQMCNLQYIDISHNNLASLDGLKELVHLRGLRADNNKIQSLEGIMCLDGLISLRLRDNILQSVDFAASKLQRLTELDLKGNCIRVVRGLRELRSLTTLNLEDNHMDTFSMENSEALWSLKYLKLGGNKLADLDVTGYPNLRVLYLDRNCLCYITGLHQVRHLDSLSLREQQDGARIDPKFIDEAFEVRKLFLSGNLLTTFAPSVDFLNLQYLELANCGLETLPEGLGQLISNVRVLNLNFNALEDIKPLLGIVRLKKLHLAGNRLARIRRTTNVLARFSSLTKVDTRNNPLTLGFYPPVSEKRLILHDGLDAENDILPFDPFTLGDGDRERDTAYAGRLDMGTKMRRRVFEILMLGGCTRLKMLDGLAVDRVAMGIKDNVWEELVKAGIIYDVGAEIPNAESESQTSKITTENEADNGSNHKVDEVAHEEAPPEERWPAEDSFA